jgi:hypothetical protein
MQPTSRVWPLESLTKTVPQPSSWTVASVASSVNPRGDREVPLPFVASGLSATVQTLHGLGRDFDGSVSKSGLSVRRYGRGRLWRREWEER